MTNSNKIKLAKLAMLFAMADQIKNLPPPPPAKNTHSEPHRKEVTPSGTSRYYFAYGEMVFGEYTHIAEFSCIAIGAKSARKKYAKFLAKK